MENKIRAQKRWSTSSSEVFCANTRNLPKQMLALVLTHKIELRKYLWLATEKNGSGKHGTECSSHKHV